MARLFIGLVPFIGGIWLLVLLVQLVLQTSLLFGHHRYLL